METTSWNRAGDPGGDVGTEVWFAPGRANLMGEHTDYNEGFVLPFALAQGVTATVTARADGRLVLRSRQAPGPPVTVALGSLAPGSMSGWAAYPAGVAWALGAAGYQVRGASIDIDSDLPVGAGVSSSAALECAAGLALCSLSGIAVAREELALIAKRAENEFVGAPTGIIDQTASLLGREGHALLLDCGTRQMTQVPFRPASMEMAALIVDTRVPHALVSGQYAARRAECEEAARLLGVAALGLVRDSGAAGQIADPLLRRRARHVITDSARAQTMAETLKGTAAGITGPEVFRYLGKLLTEGHASLRDDFGVSWEQADVAVDAAVAAGAYGAKMIGGGFGGSVLALVPAKREAAVRSVLAEIFTARGWAAPDFLDAIPSRAARRVM